MFAVSAWLWLTVLFANFAEAMAEGRGKAQADALRQARKDVSRPSVLAWVNRTGGAILVMAGLATLALRRG